MRKIPVTTPIGITLLFVASLAFHLSLGWVGTSGDLHFELDNDSAMRLVQVRDLLSGQPLRDLHQYRLGPEGTEMHWSRVVDVLLAAMIFSGKLVTSAHSAEQFAMMLWPSLWFVVALCSATIVGYLLAGRYGAYYTFAIFGATNLINPHFDVANIDHHNIQIALLMIILVGFFGRSLSALYPALSGAAVALSLHIGTELLPVLAVVALAYTMLWVALDRSGRAVRPFFISFIMIAIALFSSLVPFSAYQGGYCDAVSVDLIAPALLFASLITLGSVVLSDSHRLYGFIWLSASAVLVLVMVVALLPACLENPLANLPESLHMHWLSHVQEARSLRDYTIGSSWPLYSFFWALGVITVALSIAALRYGVQRYDALVFLAVVAVVLVMALYQVRFAVLLMAVVPIGLGYLAARIKTMDFPVFKAWRGPLAMLVVLMVVPQTWLLASVALFNDGTDSTGVKGRLSSCISDSTFREMGSLPAGLVSATSNLGSHILLHSEHSVLSAPYHRNVDGMMLQVSIALAESPVVAEKRLLEAGVDHIIACDNDPELRILGAQVGEGPWKKELVEGTVDLIQYDLVSESGLVSLYSRHPADEN